MSGINPYSFMSGWGQFTSQNAYPVQPSQIVQLPQTLQTATQAIALKGEITAQNQDGSVQIKTAQGNITLKLETPLPTGSKLNLQIPPAQNGQVPKEAFIQPTLIKTLSNKAKATAPQATADGPSSQTRPTLSASQNTDVKTLQNTAQQANTARDQQGQVIQPITLKEGQAIRLTPLPASMQSTAVLSSQLQAPPPQNQIQTVLPRIQPNMTTIQSSQTINTSTVTMQSIEAQMPASMSDFVKNIRPQIQPQTIQYQVSGDRTLRPFPVAMSINASVPPQGLTIQSDKIMTTLMQPSGQTRPITDTRVQMIIEPMHIRPPQVTTATVSMATTASDIRQQANHFSHMTLLNSQAGEAIAVSTGFVTDDGSPILQMLLPSSQSQMVSVNYPAKNLPAGTQVTLTPLPSGATVKPSLQTQAAPSLNIPQEELTQLLQAIQTTQSQPVLDLMPSPSNARNFPAAALLFLAAAKGGDLSAWLGTRNIKSIESLPQTTSKNTVQKLLSDVLLSGSGKTPTASDPAPVQSGDWRGHQLPLLTAVDLQTANIWIKQDGQDNNSDDKRSLGTRFIVDLQLSRMGSVQFDGLVRPDKQTLDLVFLTQRTIATGMQDKLKHLWYNALENLGYSGSIAFKDIA